MDNMRSHYVKAARVILRAKDMKALYLPSYRPDFKPIEKMCSKMKTILRKWKIRCLDKLPVTRAGRAFSRALEKLAREEAL